MVVLKVSNIGANIECRETFYYYIDLLTLVNPINMDRFLELT